MELICFNETNKCVAHGFQTTNSIEGQGKGSRVQSFILDIAILARKIQIIKILSL